MSEIILHAGKERIPVLYEDNHVMVVVKPPNMLSQGDDTGDADLLSILKDDIKNRYGKPGNVYLGLVQRLDRPVGGVMVFARTSKAASRLSDDIRTRKIAKTYTAIIRGVPATAKGTLKHYLLKNETTNTVAAVSPSVSGAKEAVLDYEVLDSQDGLSLVRIRLHTGRPHQIRVQFSTVGHPLFGDQRYGSHAGDRGEQLALWSTTLRFEHPVRKEPLAFRSVPPVKKPWDRWVGLIRNLTE